MVRIERVKVVDPHSAFHLQNVELFQDGSGKLIVEPTTEPATLYCIPRVVDLYSVQCQAQEEETLRMGGVQFSLTPNRENPPSDFLISSTPVESITDLDKISHPFSNGALSCIYLPCDFNIEEAYFLFHQAATLSIPMMKHIIQEKGVPNMPTLHGFLLGNTQLSYEVEKAQLDAIASLLKPLPNLKLLILPFLFPEWEYPIPNLYYGIPVGCFLYKDTDFSTYSDLVRFPFPLLSEEQIHQMKHFFVSNSNAFLVGYHAHFPSFYPEPYWFEKPQFRSLLYFFLLAYNVFVLEEYLTLDRLVDRLAYSPVNFLGQPFLPIEFRSLDGVFFFDPHDETVCALHPQLPEKRLKGRIMLPD